MLKTEAIELLGGGSISETADTLCITYQAVDKWPDVLPRRIEDRVLGALARRTNMVEALKAMVRVSERVPA